MARSSTMESAYKVLNLLSRTKNGMTEAQLKRRFPFLDIEAILPKLETPGYITHRITGYKKGTTIDHDYNDRWYPTDLGLTALAQYKESLPGGNNKKLIILLAVVIAACALIFYMCTRPAVP